jgi:hypothetical protein
LDAFFCISLGVEILKIIIMKKSIFILLPLFFIFFTSCDQAPEKAAVKEEKAATLDLAKEKAKVTELLDLLAASTESGNMEMIEKIWLPSEDVILIGTENDEKLVGWSQIKDAISGQASSFDETLISITDQNVWFDRDARTAWFFEELNYNFIYNNKAMSLDGIRFTGVFFKTDKGEWKLVQGHLSMPASIDIEEE